MTRLAIEHDAINLALVSAAQAAHQFVTFATASPLQHAVAHALRSFGQPFVRELCTSCQQRRDFLMTELRNAGIQVAEPAGTYFMLGDFSAVHPGDDRTFARRLISECGVAAIPPSVFDRARPEQGRRLVRFAFCKRLETLREAAARLYYARLQSARSSGEHWAEERAEQPLGFEHAPQAHSVSARRGSSSGLL
ncbi:MAG: aminotransferase class I/II-fold pyridoxal phosphate-dependent enzyme [Polyangiaceae bacterium]|nr:aminotransferase class I/II-fold pyridoxal phosphate-dependent enzyme [Polyangiaceae bacterium]